MGCVWEGKVWVLVERKGPEDGMGFGMHGGDYAGCPRCF